MKPRWDNLNLNEYRRGPAAAARYEKQLDLQNFAYFDQKTKKSIDAQIGEIVDRLAYSTQHTIDKFLREGPGA